ncbi:MULTISPECIES: DEAD/DEAH box helicase [unclassified Chelatococcus]|uniref:DEAD/DEAH box helicase n=1 Tax=unclassified Chelatococcus TaxID=2638111 RepID=UPI000A71CA00|nr:MULTISPECIES: DEAD/DEAH box helicase [unclassified Chelatococcus]
MKVAEDAGLFPYQEEGAAFLARVGRGLLADDMGLGKTAQAIAAARKIAARRVIIVCPASLCENWRREFKRFWPDFPGELFVKSYNKVDDFGGATTCDVLILDEAHYLKNKDAKRTRAIFGPRCDGKGGLVERAKQVFLLTGTPTPNNPAELWPLARAVFPDAILNPKIPGKPLAYWPFVGRYCKTFDNGFGIKITGGKNLKELRERIAPYVLRRRKEEVLTDLPPIRFDTLPLEGIRLPVVLNDAGKVEAEIIRKTLAEKGVGGLAEIAPHVASLRRITGLAKVGPVVEWVRDWLDAGGSKIVLFAHHKEVIAALSDAFDRAVVVTGSTTPAVRQAAVDSFQNDPNTRVFIGQLQAAGTGLTLTAASDLLFVETSWVPAENQQAAMRIHRIGQRNACLVRVATLAGSIDEDVQKAVLRKMQDIRSLWS